MTTLKKLWNRKCGYKQILFMAFPLILSTGAWSILQFVDRMFLTWFHPDALAASMPAGILNFTLVALFFGTTGYVSTFIAQYIGSGQHDKIGAVLWQSIYLAIAGGILIAFFAPFSKQIFSLIGHTKSIRDMEADYFRILCLGSIFPIMGNTLSGFYVGMGKNWPVMIINFITVGINIILDYLFIFGIGPFPVMGIKGAALATVIAGGIGIVIYFYLILQKKHDLKYKTRQSLSVDFSLIKRILTFGMPNGAHLFLEIGSFTIFLLILGRIGPTELAATNIAFNINSLAFLPMIGVGIAISILVGQYIGKKQPELAERAAYSGFQLTLLYMGTIALTYVLFPRIYIFPFEAFADPDIFAPIKKISIVLLRFIAIYSLFDSLSVIFSHAIKGAGDTKYVMIMSTVLSFVVLVIPTYVAVIVLKVNIYSAWIICTAFICIMGLAFLARFLTGKWKKMSVIGDIPGSDKKNPGEEAPLGSE